MAKYTSPLDYVRVAAPCSADWDAMIGDDRARFCGQCRLNVYNLSGMTRREAEALIAGAEGRLCVRFYRRADGTILTENCPVGLRAIKRRLSRVASAVFSTVLGFLSGLGLYTAFDGRETFPVMGRRTTTTGVMAAPPVQTLPGIRPTPPLESEQGVMVRPRLTARHSQLPEETDTQRPGRARRRK